MHTRAQLKERAKQTFSNQYWLCVGASILVALILGATGVTVLAPMLLAGPLTVGLNSFYLRTQRAQPVDIGTPFVNGFDNFGRKCGGYLWMQLFIFLWSLLLWIPGIVKALSYAMLPYLLADCPNVDCKSALKISMRMMDGHKGDLFVLYLSFFGWALLSGLTAGLVWVFYVGPYFAGTMAGFYLDVKAESLRSGRVSYTELGEL